MRLRINNLSASEAIRYDTTILDIGLRMRMLECELGQRLAAVTINAVHCMKQTGIDDGKVGPMFCGRIITGTTKDSWAQ